MDQENTSSSKTAELEAMVASLESKITDYQEKEKATAAEVEELRSKVATLEAESSPPTPPDHTPPPSPPQLQGGGLVGLDALSSITLRKAQPIQPEEVREDPMTAMLAKIRAGNVQLKHVDPSQQEKKEDPMAAMMERIKGGNVQLKKASPKLLPKTEKNDVMSEMASLLSLRGNKRPAVAIPEKKPTSQSSQMSNELFQKLKKRRGQQGEDMTDGKGKGADSSGAAEEDTHEAVGEGSSIQLNGAAGHVGSESQTAPPEINDTVTS